ncbi:MAG: neutral/alkaline non-lysosomal ceramidase N-terminal domain-containing protein [Thermodesulfobacteriota bacterium]|nr:neutral/alkaline non-lysosomal ceramidase N-terminal domain-containing protein [Thermodesulfobacteriota bacterium]
MRTLRFLLIIVLSLCFILSACGGDDNNYFGPFPKADTPYPYQEASSAGLLAGAGKADITPPAGIMMMGYADPNQISNGYHTRLYVRTLVLEDRNNTKLALVQCDLLCVSGGIHRQVAANLKDIGIDETHLLISATHTHSGPSAFFPYLSFNLPPAYDPSIHEFLVARITKAVRNAYENLKPARLAIGFGQITDTTKNRSLVAHLADYGIDIKPWQTCNPEMDPGGPLNTIDPIDSPDTFKIRVRYPDAVRDTNFRLRDGYAGLSSIKVKLNDNDVNATILDIAEDGTVRFRLDSPINSGDTLEISEYGVLDAFENYNSERYIVIID